MSPGDIVQFTSAGRPYEGDKDPQTLITATVFSISADGQYVSVTVDDSQMIRTVPIDSIVTK